MEKRIHLEKWAYAGEKVRLDYEDGSTVYIRKTDFDRAFGAIVSADKTAVIQDFSINE